MLRINVLVLALMIIFLAVISAERRPGNTGSSELAVIFTSADGTPCHLPCLFGIEPGKTPFADAVNLLMSHPALGIPKTYEPKILPPHVRIVSITMTWLGRREFTGKELWMDIYQDDNGLVGSATFHIEPSCSEGQTQVSLGELINILGIPKVNLTGIGTFIDRSYLFEDNGISVPTYAHVKDPHRVNPDDCVGYILAESPHAEPTDGIWCGFTNVPCRAAR